MEAYTQAAAVADTIASAKRGTWRNISIAALCIGLAGCQTDSPGGGLAGSVQSSLDSVKASINGTFQQVGGAQAGDPAVDGSISGTFEQTALNKLFASHPYSTKVPFENQFPRVALTILKAPPNAKANWSQAQYFKGKIPGGCFELSAVIWESRTKSTTVPPFTACFPGGSGDAARFKDYPLRGFTDWVGQAQFFASADESTGNQRTDGPVPPDAPVPNGPRYQAFYGSPWLDAGTLTGGMLAVLLLKMDFDWTQAEDRRVWVTKIVAAE